jgi:hypothetical protein
MYKVVIGWLFSYNSYNINCWGYLERNAMQQNNYEGHKLQGHKPTERRTKEDLKKCRKDQYQSWRQNRPNGLTHEVTTTDNGGDWFIDRPTRTHCIVDWVGPRAHLDDMEKKKFLTLPGLKLLPLGRPARSQSLYLLHYPGVSQVI